MTSAITDHPYVDPGDGRTECETCGKFVWRVTHSCKGFPVTEAAKARFQDYERTQLGASETRPDVTNSPSCER